jgi:3-phosphoinositide dependent protein kinase-1
MASAGSQHQNLPLPEPDKEQQERAYREQRELGKTHEYADAYAKKIHEGEIFARYFAQIREKRLLNNREGTRRNTMRGARGGERRGSVTSTDLKRRTPDDFIFKKTLGEGSYSTVFLATEKKTNRDFAIKILEKNHIKKEKKTKYVMTEKEVFNALNHPFVVKLFYTFQDDDKLYFVISYCANGELTNRIKQLGSFDEECTRFYAAEVVSALEHMHSKGIIHRDLKPENILLDENMHVQITDFGTSKILSSEDDGCSNLFVGMAQYVSPELLTEKHACKSSDLWALGCIIYQLLSGKVPFRGGNEYQTFKKISALDYTIPEGFPETGRDLVQKLLLLDPNARLGSDQLGGYAALKAHPFFNGVDWDNLYKTTPPQLDAYLPPINPHERPLYGADEADDEIEALLAKAY